MALIEYPLSVRTNVEKLTVCYSLQEAFRLVHNAEGEKARDNLAKYKAAWYQYSGRPAHRGNIYFNAVLPVLQEIAMLRHAIRLEHFTDIEYHELTRRQTDKQNSDLVDSLIGDKEAMKLSGVSAVIDTLDRLKAVRLEDLVKGDIPPDPTENFTTYTEVDSLADITVVDAGEINVDTMTRPAVSYVVKTGFAFGNFEHLVHVWVGGFDANGVVAYWGMTNGSNTYQQMADNDEGMVALVAGAVKTFQLIDLSNDLLDSMAHAGGDLYPKISRSGETLSLLMYDDANRTNLLDTLSIGCAATVYANIYAVMSRQAVGADKGSLNVYDLDLQQPEAADVGGGPGLLIAQGQI